jgi:hypothetical protein
MGHGALVFTGDLLACQYFCREPAGSLRHVSDFLDLGLLWILHPSPEPSTDNGPAHRRAGSTTVGGS